MKYSSLGEIIVRCQRQITSKSRIIMRTFLTLFSIFFTAFQLFAAPVHAQLLKQHKVSLSVHNVPLGAAIRQLASKSGVPFTYNQQQLDRFAVSVSAHAERLDRVLEDMLAGLPLTYKQLNGKVVVYADSKPFVPARQQQQMEIRGSVTDSLGNPLQGVSVAVSGMPERTTFSDANGDYRVQVPGSAAQLI